MKKLQVLFLFLPLLSNSQWVQIATYHGYMFDLQQYNNLLFIGGDNDSVNGNSSQYFTLYDGTNFTYNPTITGGIGIMDMTIFNNQLYAAGEMGFPFNMGIASWGVSGWIGDTAFHIPNNPINLRAMSLHVDGNDLYVGDYHGYVYKKTGISGAYNLINPQPFIGAPKSVDAIVKYDNTLFAAGSFIDHPNGSYIRHIAQLDTTLGWQPVGWGLNGAVLCMAVYNNELYVGGVFSEAFNGSASVNTQGFVKWDGTSWTDVSIGFNGSEVDDLMVYNNELYAVGDFHMGSNNAFGVAKFDGITWSDLGYFDYFNIPKNIGVFNNNLYVTAHNGGQYGGKIYRVNLSTEVLALQHSTSDFTISPNPTNNFINITSSLHDKKNTTISLIDILGKELYWAKLGTEEFKSEIKINMQDFSNGVYFVKLKSVSGEEEIKKIIKY